MDNKIEKDKSLLRCTLKKSVDVLRKWVLYVTYVIAAITLLIGAWIGATGIWSVIADKIYWGISFLFGVPWYIYVGGIAILAIPVYSFIWCVARELTEEDWESETAESIALFALALSVALALALFALSVALALFALALFALALFALFALALANSKSFLFIGAYLHYRKRIRASQTESEPGS